MQREGIYSIIIMSTLLELLELQSELSQPFKNGTLTELSCSLALSGAHIQYIHIYTRVWYIEKCPHNFRNNVGSPLFKNSLRNF